MDDGLLGLAFAALTVIFTVWILLLTVKYLRFRSVASGSLLSWESPRPWFFSLCLGIGFFMVVMTFLSGFVLSRFGCPVGTGDPNCDPADQNGDGLVDPLDVGFVLARFGECP